MFRGRCRLYLRQHRGRCYSYLRQCRGRCYSYLEPALPTVEGAKGRGRCDARRRGERLRREVSPRDTDRAAVEWRAKCLGTLVFMHPHGEHTLTLVVPLGALERRRASAAVRR